MALMPRLHITCSRCGKPREGIVHVCRSNSKRKATVKPVISFGKCSCGKPIGNPLTHVCRKKSDFKRRKSKAEKAARAAARKKRQAEKHDYQACADKDCKKSLCVAYKTGRKDGYDEGFEEGYGAGFAAGSASGAA
jgi:flagellar biosynthesis/type III secretory pathway protein FliH